MSSIKQSSSQPSTFTSSTISTYIPIPRSEERGITLQQLRNLCQEIHYRCEVEDWKRSIQGVTIPLDPEEVNFYDLITHFIIPQTKQYLCSYVELVSSSVAAGNAADGAKAMGNSGNLQGQQQHQQQQQQQLQRQKQENQRKPNWFVSHWWGVPVFDFVECLEQHAFDRNLDPQTTLYWICALAHCQHEPPDPNKLKNHNLSDNNNNNNNSDHHQNQCRQSHEYEDASFYAYEENSTLIEDSNLTQSSFYKAMHSCQGVVSIIDKKSISFSRLWCIFEISLAVCDYDIIHRLDDENEHSKEQALNAITKNTSSNNNSIKNKRLLHDVYAHSKNGQAVGFTDGIVASDIYPRRDDGSLDTNAKTIPGHHNGMKAIRESQFPYQACINALSIQMETSNVSNEMDRVRILNFVANKNDHQSYDNTSAIASGSLDQQQPLLEENQPPLNHESFNYINNLLRSKFATVIYRRCLEEGKNVEKIRKAIQQAPLEELQLSFHGVRQCLEEAPKLIQSLPTSLRAIDFRFSMQLFQTTADFAIGFSRLVNLQSFKLDCSTCTLTSCTHLWDELRSMTNLKVLDLNFSYNQYLQSIKGLGTTITNLPNLSELRLNFHRCSNIDSIDDLIMGLSSVDKSKTCSLKVLDLNFDDTSLTEHDVLDLCNELIMSSTFESDTTFNLKLSFRPLVNLDTVKNVRDLRRLLLKTGCCCVIS